MSAKLKILPSSVLFMSLFCLVLVFFCVQAEEALATDSANQYSSAVTSNNIAQANLSEGTALEGYSFSLVDFSTSSNQKKITSDGTIVLEQSFLKALINPFKPKSTKASLAISQADEIQSAIDKIENTGDDVGVLFVNLSTGKSISYNADQEVYGASSFKGPYCLFLCDQAVDKEGLSLRSYCTITSSYDSEGSLTPYATYPLYEVIENVIMCSDNNGYRALRYAYDSYGIDDYVENLGVSSEILHKGTSYPTYCARESALLWLRAYEYLYVESQSETSQWLADLFENTEVSFIRAGVEEVTEDARVLNKAGWNCGDIGLNSVCDAGLIEIDGTVYLMSIMTNQSDGEIAETNVSNLAATLVNSRSLLS